MREQDLRQALIKRPGKYDQKHTNSYAGGHSWSIWLVETSGSLSGGRGHRFSGQRGEESSDHFVIGTLKGKTKS